MLILTFFLFFARSFPFISLFSRGENTKSPLQGGSRALPQGFGPETRNFGRFVTEGFGPPKTLRFVYMGVITNGDGKPSNKN